VTHGGLQVWAAMAEKKEAVERLLALGADPNAPNTAEPPAREGGAAEESRPIPAVLVMAASMGLEGICRALLEAGADPAACDSDGFGAPPPRNVSSTCRGIQRCGKRSRGGA